LQSFYFRGSASCLEVTAKSAGFGAQAPGLSDSTTAKAIEKRHERWEHQLPQDPAELWEELTSLDADSRAALMAHCVSLSVNAVHEPWRSGAERIAHADQLAVALGLDMAAAGWTPTADNYLGRLTKARILEAVREAKGDASVQLIDHLKKPDMAREAERLLAGSGWLPEPLRTQAADAEGDAPAAAEEGPLPAFLAAEEGAGPDLCEPLDIAAE
jgi:ParB family chromosome partitioning protein